MMSRLACLALVAVCLLAVSVSGRSMTLERGEGTPCSFQTWAGVCTTGACVGGQKLTGKCPGSNAVKCCIPNHGGAAATSDATPGLAPTPAVPVTPATPAVPAVVPAVPAVVPAGPTPATPVPSTPKPVVIAVPGTPAGPFPYTFPYSTARHIVADFSLQRMRLYDGSTVIKEFPMSSGKLGIGFKSGVPATPSGKFRVAIKVGKGQPMGMIIEKLTPQNRIGKETDAFAHMQTRILVLEGLDANNKNTRSRSIYIHGTNKEKLLGTRQSHGCFRVGNQAVKDLFDLVDTGVEFFAVPMYAWPN